MLFLDQKGVAFLLFRHERRKNSKFGIFSYRNCQSQMSIKVLPIEPKFGDEISTKLTPVDPMIR